MVHDVYGQYGQTLETSRNKRMMYVFSDVDTTPKRCLVEPLSSSDASTNSGWALREKLSNHHLSMISDI